MPKGYESAMTKIVTFRLACANHFSLTSVPPIRIGMFVADTIMQEKSMLVKRLSCKRCLHSWYPRRQNKPKVCPKCKHSGWQQKKVSR